MAGTHSDPAMDPFRQHSHSHLHHSPRASHDGNDQPRYTVGTTAERSIIPDPSPQDHGHIHVEVEKKGDYNVTDVEKASGRISGYECFVGCCTLAAGS